MNDVFDEAYWERVVNSPEAPRTEAAAEAFWDQVIDPIINGPMMYDRKGRPISMREWGRLFDGSRKAFRKYQQVRQDYVGPYRVSTVWLGLDHSHGRGAPLIFETMVFERRTVNGMFGRYHPDAFEIQERYSTEEEALRGHYAVRRLVRHLMQVTNGPRPLPARVHRDLVPA